MIKQETQQKQLLVPTNWAKLARYCSATSLAYLKQSLERLEKGQAPTPSFPLYGKRDSSLVDEWFNTLGKLDLPDWLVEYEQTRIAKFGSQGGLPPWKDLEPTFMLYKTAIKDVSFVDQNVLTDMIREYKMLNARKLAIKDTLDHLIKTDKIETRAAGWPEFQLKKTDKLAQSIAVRFALSGDWKYGVGYVFARFNKQKQRIFMPMPFSSMLVQARYFVTFLGGIQMDLLQRKTHSAFLPWADKIGFSHCFDLMEEELNSANIRDDEYVVYFSNDFEKMDTRTGPSQYRNFVLPIMAAAHHNVHDYELYDAMMFTTDAPIVSPSGTMTPGHGTASGAEVTNGGESICNDYFQRRFLKLLGLSLPNSWRIASRRLNGDDSILVFFVKRTLDLEHFSDAVRQCLTQVCTETGFDVQTEKLEISDVFGKYCQNVLQYDPKARQLMWCYPTVLALNAIVNPEKEYTARDWDKDYRDIDIIQKLDNTSRHPAFHKFVDYVRKGMKYPLLGSSEAETKRILSKYDRYRSLQSLSERYNRTDYNISNSPTVAYVLETR